MRPVTPHVVRTKVIPPPRRARTLARPRVSVQLKQALDYRLTILQAGAGYGKSTALAALSEEVQPLLWCQVSDEDSDPSVLLLHLCYAVQHALPAIESLPIGVIEAWDGDQGALPWRGLLDQVINALSSALTAPALLVIDDAHQVLTSGDAPQLLDRLVSLAPAYLHILLAGRPTITLPGLRRLRNHGDLLVLDHTALAFTLPEIKTLFAAHYGIELTSAQGDALLSYTEGWAIALQLIWQKARVHALPTVELPPQWQVASLDILFDLLAQEVFAGQPVAVQRFLLVTATLRELAFDVCTALRRATCDTEADAGGDTAAMLAYLREHELFVVEMGGGVLRYHHIFHTFLRQQIVSAKRRPWHHAAADIFVQRQDIEAAIYHLLEAEAWEAVATLLDDYADSLVTAGRLDTLGGYVEALPPELLHTHPMLLLTLGKLDRLRSRFDAALEWCKKAETIWRASNQPDGVARALRGQAHVYLDTVNPSKAEELLEEAIRLTDGFENRATQIRIFEMLAENKLNAGRVEEAEQLRQRAESLRLTGRSNDGLWSRVLLRTGQLKQARMMLELRAHAERKAPVQTPRAHRETLLLLALIDALQGDAQAAQQTAMEGTERGLALSSPYITAVGYMRQGHATQLLSTYHTRREHYALARQQYAKSVEISQILSVPRLRVEAGWGLCRAFGYAGDMPSALACAEEAIAIAHQAGDVWVASLVRLALGAGYALGRDYANAEVWLQRAVAGFQACSDPFGRSAAQVWLALCQFRQKQTERLAQLLPDVLATCRTNRYDFLWLRPTLVGAPDERIFTPLLLHAANREWEEFYVGRLLHNLHLDRVEFHPGYQLRVHTLGGFQVWRGDELIPANGWRRKPARQLFQLLVTFHRKMLDRDQICEALWPGADPVTAQQSFKIALNALYSVLEPARAAGAESAFVIREGTTYGLRPFADLWIDADQFTRSVKVVKHPLPGLDSTLQALALYQGEYLPDARYETWAAGERERLAAIFLEAADKLSEHLIADARYSEAIDLCQRILSQDNCWERAYRNLMASYYKLGDRGQVARTYQRCVQTLREELDVAPAPETKALYERLRNR
jgi:LuxR family maltose regulon positive regulatory protein